LEGDSAEPSLRLQMILGVGLPVIAIGGGVLAMQIAELCGFQIGEISLLATFRVLMVFAYPIIAGPSAVLGEYWWSQSRKKPFTPRHIAPTMILLGVVLVFTAFLSFVLETLSPRLDFSAQVQVLGVSIALAVLIPLLIARTQGARERLRNMYG